MMPWVMLTSDGVLLRGICAGLVGGMVRSKQTTDLLEKWCRKSRIRTCRVCVIMRQTEGRQGNLRQHAEGQHVFVTYILRVYYIF